MDSKMILDALEELEEAMRLAKDAIEILTSLYQEQEETK